MTIRRRTAARWYLRNLNASHPAHPVFQRRAPLLHGRRRVSHDFTEAWQLIDEFASTGVDTVVYGVERNDGLYYPSKHAIMFGNDLEETADCIRWRTWMNMKSLIDRGFDPLRVLIDRAHDRGSGSSRA